MIYVVSRWRIGYQASGSEDIQAFGMVTTDLAKAEAFKAANEDPEATNSGKCGSVSPWQIHEVEDGEPWPTF